MLIDQLGPKSITVQAGSKHDIKRRYFAGN
jgi:hypothetical protein